SNYSSSTILTVNASAAVAITTQPTNQFPDANTTATFTVAATGSPTPTYQWQRKRRVGDTTFVNLTNGAPYSGVTTNSLSIASVNTSMGGDQFQCVVSNATSTVTSAAAKLTVRLTNVAISADNPPLLTEQPFKYTVTAGPADQITAMAVECQTSDGVWHWQAGYAASSSPQHGNLTTGANWTKLRLVVAGPDGVPTLSPEVVIVPRPAKVRVAASAGTWSTNAGTFDIGTDSSGFVPLTTYRGFLQGAFTAGQSYTLQAWGYAPAANCSHFEATLYDLAAANDAAAVMTTTGSFGSSAAVGQSVAFSPSHNGVYRLNVSYFGATNALFANGTVSYDIVVGSAAPIAATNDFDIVDNRGVDGIFTYRLGAGGGIADVVYSNGTTSSALTNGYGFPHTDGGFQWVLWGAPNLTQTEKDILWWLKDMPQFNMNQLGSYNAQGGLLAPTVSAVKTVGVNKWEVYSAGEDQWYPEFNPYMKGKFPCYTKYELLSSGVVKVYNVLLIPALSTNLGGNPQTLTTHNFELIQYNDFRRGDDNKVGTTHNLGVDAYAYSTDFNVVSNVPLNYWVNDGQTGAAPNYGHEIDENLQFAGPAVGTTRGFTVAFNSRGPSYGPAMATIFGKQQLVNENDAAVSGSLYRAGLRRSIVENDGLGFTVMSLLEISPASAGNVLEYTYYLAGSSALTTNYFNLLNSIAVNGHDGNPMPAPKLYSPNYTFSGDLLTIVNKLKDIQTKSVDIWGARTDHVDRLLR
ncbi:MAG: immunoglobulin domain-containing protein, partial [Verrucomicrobia bacterium]|nr:immunoglobulin domain-containing protein [Verrucomicrobiota bacterium]